MRSADRTSAVSWCGLLSSAMLFLSLSLTGLFLTGIAVIYTTHESRNLFSQLQQLESRRNELDVQWGQLLIEQSTFGLDGRIERKAVEELGMEVPALEDVIMVRYE